MRQWVPTPSLVTALNAAAVEPNSLLRESSVEAMKRYLASVEEFTQRTPLSALNALKHLCDLGLQHAPLAGAVQYGATLENGDRRAAHVINHVCKEGWQPARLLHYQIQRYGRRLPRYIKTGLSQAARRLYDERTALWYDHPAGQVRLKDVLCLCHPKPRSDKQSALFKFMLGHPDRVDERMLPTISKHLELGKYTPDARWYVPVEMLQDAGMRWTTVMSWLPSDNRDMSEVWERCVPLMDLPAILASLPTIADTADGKTIESICSRFEDPVEVRSSQLHPLSVWKAFRFGHVDLIGSLRIAMNHVQVPPFDGLMMVDTAPSMDMALYPGSNMSIREMALLHSVLTLKCSPNAELILHGSDTTKVKYTGHDVVSAVKDLMNYQPVQGDWDSTALVRNLDQERHKGLITWGSPNSDNLVFPRSMTIPSIRIRPSVGPAIKVGKHRVELTGVSQQLLNTVNRMRHF